MGGIEQAPSRPEANCCGVRPLSPDEFTRVLAECNLREKLANRDFRHDLDPLLAVGVASDYNIDEAGGLIIRELLSQLDI